MCHFLRPCILGQRHLGIETYVGIFPVLTGQPKCPVCPVCPNTTDLVSTTMATMKKTSLVDDGSDDGTFRRKTKQLLGFVPHRYPHYSASQPSHRLHPYFPVPTIPALRVSNAINPISEPVHLYIFNFILYTIS